MKQETRNHKLKTHIVRVLARTKLLTSSHVAGHRSKNRIGFRNLNSTIQQFNNSRFSRFAPALSLPELLIAVVIIAIISTLVGAIFLSHAKIFSDQKTQVYVSSQNRLGLDEMVNQTKEASSVDTCPAGTCGVGAVSPTNTLMVLKIWSIDVSGNPIDTSFDYIVYQRNSSPRTVTKSVYKAAGTYRQTVTNKIISADAINLLFTYNSLPPATTQVTIQLDNETNSLRGNRTISQTAKARLRNTALAKGIQISFPYAVHAYPGSLFGDDGTEDPNIIQGDVYSNGNIGGNQCIPDPENPENPLTCQIIGNASTSGSQIDWPVTGTKQIGVSPQQPLPNIDIAYWKAQAEAGGTCRTSFSGSDPPCPNFSGPALSLGPIKINGDLAVRTELTVTGPIYVTGRLTIEASGGKMKLASSFGSNSTVVVVDQSIIFDTFSQVLATSSSPKGFIVFVSNKQSTEPADAAIWFLNPDPTKPLVTILYAPNGTVHLNNITWVQGAIAAKDVNFDGADRVEYDPDVANVQFSTGP